jgi:hypothetical protein
MNQGKILASAFCASIVGMQAFVAFRPAHNDDVRFWPFLNYPMYAASHVQGEHILQARLFVTRCDAPAMPEPRVFSDVHLPQYRFNETVVRAAVAPLSGAQRRADLLRTQLQQYEPSLPCRMEVHLKTYTIGPNGLELPGSPWRLARGWILSDSATVLIADSTPPSLVR